MDAEKFANNLVYGSLLAIGYFVVAPNLKHSLESGLAKGAVGFLILVLCHAYARAVTQTAAATRPALLAFVRDEFALLFPFAVVSVVAIAVDGVSGSQPAGVTVGLGAALAVMSLVTYSTARRAARSPLVSVAFATGATMVGAVLAIVRVIE